MKKVRLLDCTLRDGAHVVGGNFGEKAIRETIVNLVEAKVDIIEVGFLMNEHYGIDSTYFDSIADVKRILPENRGSSSFSLMADFVDVSQVEPCDGTIEYFRLSFKRHRLDWALTAAQILMDKGYKVYINPVNCNVYTDQEYLEVIRRVNALKPYGFSLVDTFGVMRKRDLSARYYLVERNLNPEITIGVHLHENLGLAYSLAQHFLEIRNPKRQVTVDCSLLGMGRVPGNLCAEQIMDHMNINYGAEYNTEPAFDAIDEFIAPIKREIPWGYSIPYALSGKYGVHRTYAEYLMGKNRLRTKDIQRILSEIDPDHIEMFDEDYIEGRYRQYLSQEWRDEASVAFLSDALKEKRVVVICPGRTISACAEQVRQALADPTTYVISVNFVPEQYRTDCAFCANVKRFENIRGQRTITRLITSNVLDVAGDDYDYAFNFNDCVYFQETFCEDSTVMLLKLLKRCGCEEVFLAGFDGFSREQNNYYDTGYTREQGINQEAKKVSRILKGALSDLTLRFITPSMYDEIEE